MFDESVKLTTTSDTSLAPSLNYIGIRTRIEFDRQRSKQDKANIYIVYGVNADYIKGVNFALGNSYLELLTSLKKLILVNINISGFKLDLMHTEVFLCLTVLGLVKTY